MHVPSIFRPRISSLASRTIVNKDWVDFILGHFSSTLRINRIHARVEAVRDETADMKTFSLRPNALWPGFRPGQFVPLAVVIDGVRHERYYSLVSRPDDSRIAFSVKRQHRGLVSSWCHEHVAVGDTVELGVPSGNFVLPSSPRSLLLIAGGSGITPIYSLVQAAVAADPECDITLLYYARNPQDFAFQRELSDIALAHASVNIFFLPEQGDMGGLRGRFHTEHLRAMAPDYADRLAYVCGPGGLMDAVETCWKEEGLHDRLRLERFGTPTPSQRLSDPATAQEVPVHFQRSQVTGIHDRTNLLDTAERAGLRPAHGCRMGICRTCVCTKISGSVRNVTTGEEDHADNSRIRICVSEPIGPVTLDL